MNCIYSINWESNHDVKVIAFKQTSENMKDKLINIALNYMRKEEGEKALKNPIRDGVPDDKITEDGMFIRTRVVNYRDCVDVYNRKTNINNGYVWSSVNSSINRILTFSYTSIPQQEIVEEKEVPRLHQKFTPKVMNEDHMKALKARLDEIRSKIDGVMEVKME
jgi:hypothetical protein